MRHASRLLLAALAASVATQAASAQAIPERSARSQRYVVSARLAEDGRSLQGMERIEVRNTTPQPLGELQLHLYWNGWKSNQATWLAEQSRGLGRRADRKVRNDSYAAMDVTRLVLSARGNELGALTPETVALDLLPSAAFIAPDDGNPADESVLRVPLPQPIAPGMAAGFDLEFDLVVPRIVARAGRKDDFLLFAHWLPQLGVLEERTPEAGGGFGWNTHQFHANGEFFGEYASYDVTLDLPEKYEGKVGATGSCVEGPAKSGPGRVRYRFTQNDVHNFAWTADPRYVVVRRRFEAQRALSDPRLAAERLRVKAAAALSDAELELRDVEVTLLLQPEHADQADRHFRAVFESLSWMGIWFGRYPYPTLTVVDPRWGSGASGMEYPTLITAGSRVDPSSREFTPEGVTVHEFCHQFFYGLIGSNEFEHAWLDEGFTTYCTARILEAAYGHDWHGTNFGVDRVEGRPLLSSAAAEYGLERLLGLQALAPPSHRDTAGFPLFADDPAILWYRDLPFLTYIAGPRPPVEAQRAGFVSGKPSDDRLNRCSFEYRDGGAYRENAYYKPATALHTLQRLIGDPAWTRLLREYAVSQRFRHPRPSDFFEVVKKHLRGHELEHEIAQLLPQIFEGSGVLQYGIASVKSREELLPAGYVGQGEKRRLLSTADPSAAPKNYSSEILLERAGEVIFPVELEWKLEGESPTRERWDGKERWWRKVIPSGGKLEWARIDPERKLLLDVDWSKQEATVEGDGRASARWTMRALLAAQTQLQLFGSLR